MEARIREELARIERERGVRVLYACESGSRAWGFASPNSDWDVRFIYVHPRDWYLDIDRKRDVIEAMLPGDLDLAGWDLRKTLGLLRRSNPALIEWLRSPIVYRQDAAFVAELRRVAQPYIDPAKCFLHYLHMAQGNYRTYLQGEAVARKKYLYVLRPVLACRWIERGFGTPPMEFPKLVERVLDEADVASAVEDLLRAKMAGGEMEAGPRVPELSDFLDNELPRLAAREVPNAPSPDVEPLNWFFRRWILDAAR